MNSGNPKRGKSRRFLANDPARMIANVAAYPLRRCDCPGACERHDPAGPRFAREARSFDPEQLDAAPRELPEQPPRGWGRT